VFYIVTRDLEDKSVSCIRAWNTGVGRLQEAETSCITWSLDARVTEEGKGI